MVDLDKNMLVDELLEIAVVGKFPLEMPGSTLLLF